MTIITMKEHPMSEPAPFVSPIIRVIDFETTGNAPPSASSRVSRAARS